MTRETKILAGVGAGSAIVLVYALLVFGPSREVEVSREVSPVAIREAARREQAKKDKAMREAEVETLRLAKIDQIERDEATALRKAARERREAAEAEVIANQPVVVPVKAEIRKNSTKISIRNENSYVWSSTTVYIDGIVMGYSLNFGRMAPGESQTAQLIEFTTRSGKRFQPYERVPREVIIAVPGHDSNIYRFD